MRFCYFDAAGGSSPSCGVLCLKFSFFVVVGFVGFIFSKPSNGDLVCPMYATFRGSPIYFRARVLDPQAAFNKIPSGGGPLLPLLNTAIVLGAVGYCGYNSVFTGETRA